MHMELFGCDSGYKIYISTKKVLKRYKNSTYLGIFVKIVQYNGQYRVTIPKELVKDKSWDDGATELRFVEDEHGRIWLKEIRRKK